MVIVPARPALYRCLRSAMGWEGTMVVDGELEGEARLAGELNCLGDVGGWV